jgi:hypothetical protein
MVVTAPSASLKELFDRVSKVTIAEMLREMSMLGGLLKGLGFIFLIAAVEALLLTVGARAGVKRDGFALVICFVLGTIQGVITVVRARVKFVDKRTRQDVTFTVPFTLGFLYGLVAFGAELGLSYVPLVPTLASTTLLSVACFTIWFLRYRPRATGLSQIPARGITEAMLSMANPSAQASVTWNLPPALPPDGLNYHADVVRNDGVRIQCTGYIVPQRGDQVYQFIADFGPAFRWRYANPQMSIDGVSLESTSGPQGTRVQCWSGPDVRQSLSMTANACQPLGDPTAYR